VFTAYIIRAVMEAVSTSEMSNNCYQTIQRNIPEDSHLYTHSRENLRCLRMGCSRSDNSSAFSSIWPPVYWKLRRLRQLYDYNNTYITFQVSVQHKYVPCAWAPQQKAYSRCKETSLPLLRIDPLPSSHCNLRGTTRIWQVMQQSASHLEGKWFEFGQEHQLRW
jgi:hypothetical protein